MAPFKSIVGGPLELVPERSLMRLLKRTSPSNGQRQRPGLGHTRGWRSPPGTAGISLRTAHLPMSATPLHHLACPT